MADESDEDLDALPPGTRRRSVGVIVAAIVLMCTLVWLLSGGGAEFFHPKIYLHTYLSDSGGLIKDADVLLNGVAAGKVADVRLAKPGSDPNRAIQVDLRVDRKFMDAIPVDSIAALTADNLLGDKYVDITVGRADQHVANGAEIASLVQSGPFNPADLVMSLQTTLQRVDSIITEIQQGNSPLAQFVNGSEFYDGLLAQIDGLRETIRSVTDPKSPAGEILFTNAAYDQVRQPILNLDRMLEQLQLGENPAGKLLTDPALYDSTVTQIRGLHRSLADMNSGTGSNAALLKSDQQYRKLQAQMQSINASIDQLTDPKGKFGQYLQSRHLYDAVATESQTAGTFLGKFRQNPQKFLRVKPFGSKHPKKP